MPQKAEIRYPTVAKGARVDATKRDKDRNKISDADQHSDGILADAGITTVVKTGSEIDVSFYDQFVMYDSWS